MPPLDERLKQIIGEICDELELMLDHQAGHGVPKACLKSIHSKKKKNPKLAKSLADASWSMFFTHLLDKAEEAGREVVRVNPAYTSQTCSACGHRQAMPLSVRVYECPHCGLVMHRDHNGSKNILHEGLQACGRAGRVVPEAPGAGAVGSRHHSTEAFSSGRFAIICLP